MHNPCLINGTSRLPLANTCWHCPVLECALIAGPTRNAVAQLSADGEAQGRPGIHNSGPVAATFAMLQVGHKIAWQARRSARGWRRCRAWCADAPDQSCGLWIYS